MLKISNTQLATALSRAEKIVESRNTIPILGMVRLTAERDFLEVVTTNLDLEYRQTLEALCDEPFSVCVDAKRLAQMANVASKDISMSLADGVLTVKSGRSRWQAPTLSADEFPIMPVGDLSEPLKIDGDELAKIIERTIWAASTEVTRAYLSGMYFDNVGGLVSFVSTNAYVMPVIDTIHKWPEGAPNFIAARPFLNAVRSSADGPCNLAWDDKKMRFTCGDTVITGKAIDGQFPSYRNAIPQPSEPVGIDAGELLAAVKRVRIASDAKERKLRIRRGENAIRVRIEGTAGFEAEEEILADCQEGFESGVNADYLSGMLDALDTDSITIEQSEPGAPFLMRPASQRTYQTFTGVVWSLRI